MVPVGREDTEPPGSGDSDAFTSDEEEEEEGRKSDFSKMVMRNKMDAKAFWFQSPQFCAERPGGQSGQDASHGESL
ncbi:unnamed protein product [Arctogadus glacialis]